MTTTLAAAARTSVDESILDAIGDVGVALVIWQRNYPPDVASLLAYPIGNIRLAAALDQLPEQLATALDKAGYPASAVRAAIRDDILRLAGTFARIMQVTAVQVRLEQVVTNACRKFHADYVTARLITTYAGQGTQWINGNYDDPAQEAIHQLSAGDVGIFKGRHWDAERAAIHRSPPIEGTGEARLILVVDPVVSASAAS